MARLSPTARLAASACIELMQLGKSVHPVFGLADASGESERFEIKGAVLSCICAALEGWSATGKAPPFAADAVAQSIVLLPPQTRRLAISSLLNAKGMDSTLVAICDAVQTIGDKVNIAIREADPAEHKAEQPTIIVNVPEQPAPVVNAPVTVNLPEQPAAVNKITVQVPDQPAPGIMKMEIVGMPERITETTVTRDREGNIRETVQVESDGHR